MYVGPEEPGGTRGTIVVELILLRSASHLGSKMNVGMSLRLDTPPRMVHRPPLSTGRMREETLLRLGCLGNCTSLFHNCF